MCVLLKNIYRRVPVVRLLFLIFFLLYIYIFSLISLGTCTGSTGTCTTHVCVFSIHVPALFLFIMRFRVFFPESISYL